MLTIQNFRKHYSESLVLAFDNLSVGPGVTWIKGENGSGKSTLFKSIAGLIPCSGSIQFDDGISLHRDQIQFRQRVNYSEAEPVFPGFVCAADLVTFIGDARRTSQEQRHYYTHVFGIDDYIFKPCEACSSGMLKKISLVLAFLGSTSLIILDEPLVTLDENARHTLFQELRKRQSSGTSFLISSHHMIEGIDLEISKHFTITNKTLVALA